MNRFIARWLPKVRSKFNVGFDLVAVVAVIVMVGVAQGVAFSGALVAFTALAAATWATASFVIRYYDPWAERSALEELALLSLLVASVAIVTGALRLGLGLQGATPEIGRVVLFLWPAVAAGRIFVFRRLDLRDVPMDDVLIVGTGNLGRCTAEDLRNDLRGRRSVVGFLRFEAEAEHAQVLGHPVLGPVSQLEQLLRERVIDEVYVAGCPSRDGGQMQEVVRVCERYGIPFALPVQPFRMERARSRTPSTLRDGYLHYVTHEPRPYQRALKRLFDLGSAAAALIALSPLLLAIAALVKLTSKGPVFFLQRRAGLRGRPFNMIKFRTMVVNAEQLRAQLEKANEQTGPVFKMKHDPRITSVGRFLRKHSLDELPQLFNVLRGDMSVVGPRPPLPSEVEKYEGWQRRRLSVRPGLTCIWQVSGRNQISFKDWMVLDMRYIDNWSFGEDVNLILKTFPVVLTGRGAS